MTETATDLSRTLRLRIGLLVLLTANGLSSLVSTALTPVLSTVAAHFGGGAGGAATKAIIVGTSGNRSVTYNVGKITTRPTTATCTKVEVTIGNVEWLGRCLSLPTMRSNMAASCLDVVHSRRCCSFSACERTREFASA